MKLDVTGIIIKEMDLSDSDQVVTILTREKAVISAIAKRSKTIRNRLGGMMQPFAYGTFTLFCAKNGYILEKCEIKEAFLGLRDNLRFLSLAQYFCELCLALKPEIMVSGEVLRVFLNSIFYLINEKMSETLIKSIFELRVCSLCGYMPRLEFCAKCGKYDDEVMYFSIEKGKIFCKDCNLESDFNVLLSSSLLCSLRYIVYCGIEKLFNFSVSEDTAEKLSKITEKYIVAHVHEKFKSLEFYKVISA